MRKQMIVGLVIMLLVGIVSACGGNNNEPSSSGNNASASNGAGTDTPKKAELTLMLTGLGRFKEQFDQYLKQFAAKEKAEKGIDVTYNLEVPSDANLLKTRLASGDAPDIFSFHAAFDGPIFEKGGYLPDLSGEPFVGKLIDTIRQVVTINDKVVGVPMESFSWSYLYNKEMFDKYGLKVPTTLSEMKQVVETLKSNGETPFMLAYKEASFPGWLTQLSFESVVAKQSPDWWDRMNKGEASFSELKDKGMFDIIDLVNGNGTKRPLEVGADDGLAKFANGEAAMLITGTWYADSILKANPNFKLGLGALPVNDDPESTMVNLAVSTTLSVYPESPNKAVATDFLNYILDDKDSSAFFDQLKFNKVAKDQQIETFPWTEQGNQYVESGHSYLDQSIPQSANEAIGKMSQSYFAGQISQDELVAEIDKAWKKSVQVQK
ncbi:ABC transporter substrate-binding protein [Cohnella lupini]|uniref:Raffinose/stachyose/melibiose transport system substrate-binding protein n=1 Tax=Cohnella lupini TaxID=1294267 RepID=A0A3D9IV47_9BACL|nr:extracellular solute-binding protein [Cohnella lupini]RED65517.1 raffinose/stachyose/melibiose transport system substrate-binding protein [Cohnella lupini]